MKKIDGKKMKELMEKNSASIIDVDSETDFRKNHIKGAVNIPHDAQDFVQKFSKRQSRKDQDVVLCGQDKVSKQLNQLSSEVEKAGYNKVYQYQAGPEQWRSDKLGIQKQS